jgi:hypothetical protein
MSHDWNCSARHSTTGTRGREENISTIPRPVVRLFRGGMVKKQEEEVLWQKVRLNRGGGIVAPG